MDVTMTEVKEYMECWLTKRTVEMKKDYEEQLSTIKVSADHTLRSSDSCPWHLVRQLPLQGELEASQLEVGLLNGRLGESEDLRVKLEEARELIQSMDDKLTVVQREAWDLKRSREEVHTKIKETEVALVAVKRTNATLLAEIQKKHDYAEKIMESWSVIKATMEEFQCGELDPRTYSLHWCFADQV